MFKEWGTRCNKWRYESYTVAMRGLHKMRFIRAQRNEQRMEKSVYHCKRCHGWHLSGLLQMEEEYNSPELRRELADAV